MEENDTCVYMHIKKTNREAFYIGIGNSKRPYDNNRRSEWWKSTVNKYGYEIIVLKEGISWSDACKIEIDLIKYFGRRDLGEGPLVNMTNGGDGTKGTTFNKGKKRSEEQKEYMSKLMKGRYVSSETRSKMSKWQSGSKSFKSILTEDIVIEILKELRGDNYRGKIMYMSKKYGVGHNHKIISDIKNNKTWKHICRETLTIIE